VIPKLNHFGHLLTDFLMPYFFALQIIGFSEGARLNIVTSSRPNALILAFIEAVRQAGYEVTHIEGKLWQEIRIPRLLHATTHTKNLELKFATPEAIRFARDHLLKALPPVSETTSRRIFLLRGETKTRQVSGEAELAHKLEQIGFRTLVGKWSNLAEQITAFRDADIIVGAHGAGLANILWSKPEATLIELFANNARKTTGLHWASAAGLNYIPLNGSDERDLQSFSIDAEEIFKSILALL
jgi:capsular polysaccharide biosynthesis protein